MELAKLRSLTRRRRFARPLAAFLFIAFIASHVVYIWADANFYRPITMQRANLPLSYPMTARRFLEKHGLLDAQEYQRRLIEQGNPDAVSVQYPLSELRYRDMGTGQNVLLITVDGLNYSRFEKQMPALAGFAEQNIFVHAPYELRQHYRQRHLWPVLWYLAELYGRHSVDPYACGINYCA